MELLEQQTIIDQIEIKRDGTVQLRLNKQILRDGEPIAEPRYHRAAWEPGTDFEASTAIIDNHLIKMGEAPVDPAEWDRVRSVIGLVQTPEIVAAFQAARDKKLAKQSTMDGG